MTEETVKEECKSSEEECEEIRSELAAGCALASSIMQICSGRNAHTTTLGICMALRYSTDVFVEHAIRDDKECLDEVAEFIYGFIGVDPDLQKELVEGMRNVMSIKKVRVQHAD